MDMGFSYENSVRSLTLHGGNEESAIHYLLGSNGGSGSTGSYPGGSQQYPPGHAPSAPPLSGYPSVNSGYPPLPPT